MSLGSFILYAYIIKSIPEANWSRYSTRFQC